jgi:hypothetical protein
LVGEINFSLLHNIQTGSGAHPTSYPMDTVDCFPRGKYGRGIKLTTELYLVLRLRIVELYLHFLIRIQTWCFINQGHGITLPLQ